MVCMSPGGGIRSGCGTWRRIILSTRCGEALSRGATSGDSGADFVTEEIDCTCAESNCCKNQTVDCVAGLAGIIVDYDARNPRV